MRVLLRRAGSRRYYAGRGRSLAAAERAVVFATAAAAAGVARREGLVGMEIVLSYNGLNYEAHEVCLPVVEGFSGVSRASEGRTKNHMPP